MAASGPEQLAERLAVFSRYERVKRQLEAALETVKAEIKQLEPGLIEDMVGTQMQRANVGGLTLYIRRDKWVHKKSGTANEVMCETLRQAGWGHLVEEGYNAARLKSAVLEKITEAQQADEEAGGISGPIVDYLEALPAPIRDLVEIGETPRIGAQVSA